MVDQEIFQKLGRAKGLGTEVRQWDPGGGSGMGSGTRAKCEISVHILTFS